jgi:hypothetical protein
MKSEAAFSNVVAVYESYDQQGFAGKAMAVSSGDLTLSATAASASRSSTPALAIKRARCRRAWQFITFVLDYGAEWRTGVAVRVFLCRKKF